MNDFYNFIRGKLLLIMLMVVPTIWAQQTFTNFQAANYVVGQAGFTTASSACTATGLNGPSYIAISSKGVLAIGQQSSGRVNIYNTAISSNGAAANVVVGKANPSNCSYGGATSSSISDVEGVAFSPDGNKLIVSDGNHHRVLIWNTIPTSSGQPADVVIGQPDFASTSAGTSASKFNNPQGIFVSGDGKLFVSDRYNNRVLIWNSIPTTNNVPANIVIGQPNFSSFNSATSASGLNSPWGVTVSPDGKLLVADEGNNRVMIWNQIPAVNGVAADVVIGQNNFTTSSGGISATKLSVPVGVTVSPNGQLAIGEFGNSRVLIYNSIPNVNDAAANVVLGQPNFTSSGSYSPSGTPSASNMYNIYNCAFDLYGRLFVTGRSMNRALVFGTIPTTQANLAISMQTSNAASCSNMTNTLTVTVTNNSPNEATGVIASASFPAGFTYSSHSASSGSFNPVSGYWTVGAIPANSSVTLTINGIIGNTGNYTAYASILQSNQLDNNLNDNSANVNYTISNNTTPAPSGDANQHLCANQTIGDLQATGSNIQWYSASSGGTSLASGTILTNTTYYASQTVGSCESAGRLAVVVTLTPTTTYYADSDADGFGDINNSVESCSVPVGYVLNSDDCNDTLLTYVDTDGDGVGSTVLAPCGVLTNTDCDDNDAAIYQTATYYIDTDGDGFTAGTFTGCFGAGPSAGYSATTNGSDCDDNLITYADDDGDGFGSDVLSPCSGITNSDDCDDTLIYYVDADGDGFGTTEMSACSAITNNTDCDDDDAASYMEGLLYVDADGDGFTSGQELLCHGNVAPTGYSFTSNGEDCDDNTIYYVDADGDGFGSSEYSACSGITNNSDCHDNVLMYVDNDGDGVGSTELAACSNVFTNSDCDDSNPTMNAQYPFYPDNDGDGYGEFESLSVLLCAVNAATPPAGYSVNATDCDDTIATTNPGATEIGYNLSDDDCDGLIDEGFPPKIVNVSAATCGTILPALDTYIYANLIAGAQGYRWKVTTISGVNPGQVQILDTPLRSLKLTQLPNYAYATTYKIEAAVYFAGFLQPFTASSCTVSTPEIKTKLTSCPQLLTSFTNLIYANSVPFATGYRFKITDPVNPSNTQTIDRAVREFRMTNITAFEVLHGKAYIVQVAVRNTDGSYLPFGDPCAVTTSQFPTTEIGSAQCDNGFGLPYAVPSMNTPIYANSYPGAIAYVFRLTGLGLPPAGVEVTKNLRVFKLSDFAGMGINPGQSYNVNVRIIFEQGAPIGSYGKTCTLTVPAASSRMIEMPFDAVAFPNPFSDTFNVSITSSMKEVISAKVYDMTGRMLDSIEFESTDAEISLGDRYPSGIYNVIISQGSESKTLRMIKR